MSPIPDEQTGTDTVPISEVVLRQITSANAAIESDESAKPKPPDAGLYEDPRD